MQQAQACCRAGAQYILYKKKGRAKANDRGSLGAETKDKEVLRCRQHVKKGRQEERRWQWLCDVNRQDTGGAGSKVLGTCVGADRERPRSLQEPWKIRRKDYGQKTTKTSQQRDLSTFRSSRPRAEEAHLPWQGEVGLGDLSNNLPYPGCAQALGVSLVWVRVQFHN